MSRLLINKTWKKVASFPHHKYFAYQAGRFFQAKSIGVHMSMDRFITLQELFKGWKNRCSIPRLLMLDPTSRCNLKCKGCWAADYDRTDELSLETMDDIICQAKGLGIRYFFMTGGEPLLRREDIIKLCEKHRHSIFGVFTNATLIDEIFADEIARVGNLNMFVSIEGTREDTDFRRGEGTYDKVMAAMDILKSRDIGFAFSVCYHGKNYKTIASSEFLDFMQQKGAWFGWLFHYMPVGKDADLSLVCTPEQRAYVQQNISEYCRRNRYTIIDFWNNGHLAFGCIAAGNGFVHINARGDVEPCAFCHYADSNIHEVSLLEALQSPFFTTFRKNQPFSDNPLRACPLIDVPEAIIKVVQEGNANSTHSSAPETAEELAEKSKARAELWEPVAKMLFEKMPSNNQRNFPVFLKYHSFKKKHTDGRREK